jgi:2-iminobutanoate/2-iminopropanoate deaminase
MNEIAASRAPSAIGPYSQGIVAGGLVFTSGQLGIDVQSGELGRDVQEQTRLALTNVQSVVKAAGGTLAQVVKVMIFLANMDDFAQVNEVYASFFVQPYPARSCVQVARLPKDALVEIEAVCQLS